MVRKTATVLPRLFNRSNDHVPQSSSADSPQTLPSTPPFSNNEVRTIRTGLRARSRKLEDLVSVSQWERVFSMRKRTLMTKALDLEDATGAIVTVTVRVNEDVYYYASSDITQNMLEKSNLLGVNNYHVTKQSLRPGGFSSSNFPSQYLSGDQQLFQTPEKTKVVENTQLSKHQTNNQQISSQSKRNQHFPIQPMTHQQITNQLLINQQKTPEFQSRKQQSSHQPTNQNFNQQSSHTSVIKQATLKHQNKIKNPNHPAVIPTPNLDINLTVEKPKSHPINSVINISSSSDSSSEEDSDSSQDSDSTEDSSSSDDESKEQETIPVTKKSLSSFDPIKNLDHSQIPESSDLKNAGKSISKSSSHKKQMQSNDTGSSQNTIDAVATSCTKSPTKNSLRSTKQNVEDKSDIVPKTFVNKSPKRLESGDKNLSSIDTSKDVGNKEMPKAFISREAAKASTIKSPCKSPVNIRAFTGGKLETFLSSLQLPEENKLNVESSNSYDFVNNLAVLELQKQIEKEKEVPNTTVKVEKSVNESALISQSNIQFKKSPKVEKMDSDPKPVQLNSKNKKSNVAHQEKDRSTMDSISNSEKSKVPLHKMKSPRRGDMGCDQRTEKRDSYGGLNKRIRYSESMNRHKENLTTPSPQVSSANQNVKDKPLFYIDKFGNKTESKKPELKRCDAYNSSRRRINNNNRYSVRERETRSTVAHTANFNPLHINQVTKSPKKRVSDQRSSKSGKKQKLENLLPDKSINLRSQSPDFQKLPVKHQNRVFPNSSLFRGLRYQCRKTFEKYLSPNYLLSNMSLSGYVRKMENKNEFLVIPQLLTQQTCFKKLREDLSKQLKEFYKERGKNRSINTFVYEALQDSKSFEVKNGIYFRRKSVLRLEK